MCSAFAVKRGDRAVATEVPLLAQRDREFFDPPPSEGTPPPFGQEPGPEFIRDDFRGSDRPTLNPGSNENQEPEVEIESGVWLYRLYSSEEADSVFSQNLVHLEVIGDEVRITACGSECDELSLPPEYFRPYELADESLLYEDDDMIFESVEARDGRSFFGRLENKGSEATIYYSLNFIIQEQRTSALDGFNATRQTIGTNLRTSPLGKSSGRDTTVSHAVCGPGKLPNNGKFSQGGRGNASKVDNLAKNQQKADRDRYVGRTAEEVTEAGQNAASQRVSDEEWLKKVIRENNQWFNYLRDFFKSGPRGGGGPHATVVMPLSRVAFGSFDHSLVRTKNLYTHDICASAISKVGRGSRVVRLRAFGRIALRGARLGLRVAGRFAIPLAVLDIGLTAYEFCSSNSDICRAAWSRVISLFRREEEDTVVSATVASGICRVSDEFWNSNTRIIASVRMTEVACTIPGPVMTTRGIADGTDRCGVCHRNGNNTFGQAPDNRSCRQPEDRARQNRVPQCPSNWAG